jgi:hypothetical protein
MDKILKSAVIGEHTMFLRTEPGKKPGLPSAFVMECVDCGHIPENGDRRIPKRLHEWTDCNQPEAEARFQREAINHTSHASLWGQIQGLVGM